MIDHGLLLACHFVVFERPETIAYQNQAVGIGSLLRAGDFRQANRKDTENPKTHRGPPSESDCLSLSELCYAKSHWKRRCGFRWCRNPNVGQPAAPASCRKIR